MALDDMPLGMAPLGRTLDVAPLRKEPDQMAPEMMPHMLAADVVSSGRMFGRYGEDGRFSRIDSLVQFMIPHLQASASIVPFTWRRRKLSQIKRRRG